MNKIKVELIYVLVVSLIVHFLTNLYADVLPDMPLTIPVFVGTAISILLSFKLNQSYDRWWEARKIWGSIVNDSRTLVLQLQGFAHSGNDSAIQTIALRQIGWCQALCFSLRKLDPLPEVAPFLEGEDLRQLNGENNVPLALLEQQIRDLRKLRDAGQLELFAHVQLDSTLVRLCDSMGRAERIKATVFPVTYRLFLHFTIYMFVVMLAISLTDVAGYFEIPMLLVISSAFFLLERTANHMQDPFENRPTDTPMTAIVRTIEINLKQLIKHHTIPEPIKPKSFYIT